MLTQFHLTTIIHAGRSALRRARSRHPIDDDALRAVAQTYARAVQRQAPGHADATELLRDVQRVMVLEASLRAPQAGLTYLMG